MGDERTHPELELWWRHADEDLSAQEQAALRQHLAQCAACRRRVEESEACEHDLAALRRELRDSVPPPPAAWRSWEELTATAPPQRWRLPAWLRLPAAAAAIGAAALAWDVRAWSPASVAERVPAAASRSTGKAPAPTEAPVFAPKRLPSTDLVPPPQPPPTTDRRPGATLRDELAAIVILHELGADLGEPVELARDATGRLTLTLLGITGPRRDEISRALAAVPEVRVVTAPTARVHEEVSIPEPGHRLSGHWRGPLAARLGGEAALRVWAEELLERSEQASVRARSLADLAERFGSRKAELDPSGLALLERLQRDHATALQEAAARLHALTRPLEEQRQPDSPPRKPASDRDLLSVAREADVLVNALLAGGEAAVAREELPATLARVAAELDAAARQQ